jgi:hypothetical protein
MLSAAQRKVLQPLLEYLEQMLFPLWREAAPALQQAVEQANAHLSRFQPLHLVLLSVSLALLGTRLVRGLKAARIILQDKGGEAGG